MTHAIILLALVLNSASFAAEVPERCVTSMGIPTYPRLAQQARIEGAVKVVITVDEAGVVVRASAMSGHQMLQAAAVDNAKTWRFAPSAMGKLAVLVITYEYRIEGQEVEMTDHRCPRVKLDLPERVEVSSPPIIVKMEGFH
jgi:TonB family protein